jgi:hypothetical protein
LYEYHDHRGMNKMYKAVESKFVWPNVKKEIEEYVKKCKICQVNKLVGPKNRASMEI